MKRIAALCAALALTLAMAAPAAAAQKVHIEDESGPFVFPPPEAEIGPTVLVNEDYVFWRHPWFFGQNWACTGDIFHRQEGKNDLWFWYPKSVDTSDEAEYMPEDRAWPWVKGKEKGSGVDYFFENADMTGKVASGKWRASTRLYDHHLGSPGMTDPETWKVQNTGKFWGINLPGMGTVFHESGNWRGNIAVYLPEKEVLEDWGWYFRGNMVFDYDELCEYFGAGPALYPLEPWPDAPPF